MTRQPVWITADQAADLLSVSKATIYRMMQASEYSAAEDAPGHCRRFVGNGFPRPIRLSEHITRIDREALEQWVAGHYGGHYEKGGETGRAS
jgi:excisionase family DNA binding protein